MEKSTGSQVARILLEALLIVAALLVAFLSAIFSLARKA